MRLQPISSLNIVYRRTILALAVSTAVSAFMAPNAVFAAPGSRMAAGYSPEEPINAFADPTCPTAATNPDKQCCVWSPSSSAYVWVDCRNAGCFAADTKVKMADGSFKAVDTLNNGDMVYNPIRKSGTKISRITAGPEPFPLIELGVGEQKVSVTRDHPVLTESGVKRAIELTLADKVQIASGEFVSLDTLRQKPVEGKQTVWNFHMDGSSDDPKDHVVLSNGVVTGDLALQEEIAPKESAEKTAAIK